MELVLVRHGESVGNVAAAAADAAGADVVDVDVRDADAPLTDRGIDQARAVGAWLRSLGSDRTPTAVWCSSYLRARQTARAALDAAGTGLGCRVDERLRDRELGVFDRLTARGVTDRYPEQARRRAVLGKFSYRPPEGESWADVALRVRSVLHDVDAEEAGGRVLVVTHDAVVLLVRYVGQRLDEGELFAVAGSVSVANASITRLVRPTGTGPWALAEFNATAHLGAAGAETTEHPGRRDVGPR